MICLGSNMKKYHLVIWLALGLFSSQASAANAQTEIRDFLKTLFSDNNQYVSELSHAHLAEYLEQQNPRATIVACADSRVQSNAFHSSPENDLFFIRNIGNQIQSAQGSVEYGINHLHTPILLIIGHSHCGAIQAALGDYSKESPAIRHELDFLHLPKAGTVDEGVIENVHQQVAFALKKFKDKVRKGELIVVGTVYDFRDDFGHGHGRLILIDLNGEKDAVKLKNHEYIKGLDGIAIGGSEKTQ